MSSFPSFAASHRRPAVVLGTDEVASAVAAGLCRAGYEVVMCHDPERPVIRRGMAFHDVLWGEAIALDGIAGVPLDRAIDVHAFDRYPSAVRVGRLGLVDLLPVGPFSVLVDARAGRPSAVPDLRCLAGISIGVGDHFRTGVNCDVAVTASSVTPPHRRGGAEGPADRPSPEHHTLRAAVAGRWRTSFDPGMRVFRGMVVGHLDGSPIGAAFDGILRGVARDGSDIPEGAEIVEIDLRTRGRARWTGIDERARSIAVATTRALDLHAWAEGSTH